MLRRDLVKGPRRTPQGRQALVGRPRIDSTAHIKTLIGTTDTNRFAAAATFASVVTSASA